MTSAEEKNGGTACSGTQQWKQAFTYDRFGNRNFDLVNTTSNVLGPNPTISQSTNRISSGQNYGYDSAGNLTSDPTTPVNGIVYDDENRQTQSTKSGQATNSYYYDGDGHRVKKIDRTGTTVFVYNAGGQLIAEYTAGNPSSGGTSYLTTDHLGSTRLVIKSDGTTTRHDYLPFGEEIQAGIGGRTTGQGYVVDGVRQKFTQKERDNESGLDYFLARYYGSSIGRFTSPDRPFADQKPRDAQSWNLYSYVTNNPQVVLALGSPDIKEAHEAVLEVVRRGEPMIPHLLKLKGHGQAFRGYGLGHANASQLISLPSGDDKRDKGHVVTLEVAALYLICAIYRADLSFAQSPYLTDLSLQPIKRRTFNSTRLISKAWRSTTAWGSQLRKVGLESLRATNQDPLSGSGVAFW